jgi:hypothetical protein
VNAFQATAFDGDGKEIKMWDSPYRLYWTTEGKLTTDRYENGLPLVLACTPGGAVPEDSARQSGLIDFHVSATSQECSLDKLDRSTPNDSASRRNVGDND